MTLEEKDKSSRTSKLFSALQSPIRLKILEILSETKRPLHIAAVSRELAIDYAALYRHVEILQEIGLLEVFDVGRSRVLNIARPDELKRLLMASEAL